MFIRSSIAPQFTIFFNQYMGCVMSTTKRGILFFFVLCFVTLIVTTIVKTQTGLNNNHFISLATAERYVINYVTNRTAPQINGGLFDRDAFDAILRQPDCEGIRYYYAKKDDGSPTIVVVGVNSAGNDIETGIIAEEISPCPPFCGSPGTLKK
jgi:hypothetical protein